MSVPGFSRTFMAAVLMLMVSTVAICGAPQMDIDRLGGDFDHWQTLASGDDFIYMDNTTWGEYFIFWGPAPETMPKQIDEAFVLETVKQFRGDLPAGWKAGEGEKVKIHGHKGFSVTGVVEEEGIETRYTVYHCNKSDRLFLSQIDRFTGCGTPETVTERLLEMERTISCHGVNRRINNPKVPLKMNFPAINITFYISDGWRADIYREGSNEAEGSVWTLPINSVQRVFLARVEAANAAAAGQLVLERYRGELLKAGSGRTVELTPDAEGPPTALSGHHLLKGSILVKDEAFAWDSGEHLFRLYLWQQDGRWNGLVHSILSRDEFEGKRVYLQPDETSFTAFEESLAKAVDEFPAP